MKKGKLGSPRKRTQKPLLDLAEILAAHQEAKALLRGELILSMKRLLGAAERQAAKGRPSLLRTILRYTR